MFQCLPAQQNETVMPSKVKKTILPKGSSISSEKTNYLSMLHCIIFSKLMQLAMEMSACTIHCLTDMWWGCRFLAKMCTDHTNSVSGCMQGTEQLHCVIWCCNLTELCQGCSCVTRCVHRLHQQCVRLHARHRTVTLCHMVL